MKAALGCDTPGLPPGESLSSCATQGSFYPLSLSFLSKWNKTVTVSKTASSLNPGESGRPELEPQLCPHPLHDFGSDFVSLGLSFPICKMG